MGLLEEPLGIIGIEDAVPGVCEITASSKILSEMLPVVFSMDFDAMVLSALPGMVPRTSAFWPAMSLSGERYDAVCSMEV